MIPRCELCGGVTHSYRDISPFYLCSRCGSHVGLDRELIPDSQVLHLTPFLESLPDADLGEEELFRDLVLPYLQSQQGNVIQQGDRFQIKGVDFKVLASLPLRGRVSTETLVFVDNPAPCLVALQSATILPIAASLEQTECKDAIEEVIQPYFHDEIRHLVEGEVIYHKGIQLKVVSCTPIAGIVDETTTLYVDGAPIPDLQKIHLLPMEDSMSADQIGISEEELVADFLRPFFEGTMQYVCEGDTIPIRGIQFKVVASEPRSGIFTLSTVLFANGPAITAADVRAEQLASDERMARQIQFEAASEQMGMRFNPRDLAQASNVLQNRLEGLLDQLPADHNHRAAIEMMAQRLRDDPSGINTAQLLMALHTGEIGVPPSQMRPVNSNIINSLPTFVYNTPRAPTTDPDNSSYSLCLPVH